MKYRPEIDGLRAVAVIPVIFFHVGLDVFKGGFIGVDIFFVISGYLITNILAKEYEAGTFSFWEFYERRARRLLPALYFAVICCFPFAWVLLLPTEFVDFGQSLVAVVTFSSNILFWLESGYFSAAAELKPLLHTWSLAVEEQFYIVFPLVLGLLIRLGKASLIGGVLLLGLASFSLAHLAQPNYSSAAYYLLPMRAWELLAGALIALLPSRTMLNTNRLLADLLSYIGFGLITYALLTFDHQTAHPALPTLLPIIGTCLVISFSISGTSIAKILRFPPVVGIGLMSYSIYLWHQPLIVFTKHLYPKDFTLSVSITLISLTLVSGYLSWRFIEKPFRSKYKVSTYFFTTTTIAGVVLIAGFGLWIYLKGGYTERIKMPTALEKSFERTEAGKPCFNAMKGEIKAMSLCNIGANDEPRFALFGDSHARSLLPSFDVAAQKLGVGGVFAGAPGCPPLQQVYTLRPDQGNQLCNELNNRMLDEVRSKNIPRVYLAARWTHYTDGGYSGTDWTYLSLAKSGVKSPDHSRNAFRQGLANTLNAYHDAGAEVILIEQVPQQLVDPRRIIKNSLLKGSIDLEIVKRYSVSLELHESLNRRVTKLFDNSAPAALRLSFTPQMCADTLSCMAADNSGSYYYDEDHLSIYGASYLVPKIESSIREIQPSIPAPETGSFNHAY